MDENTTFEPQAQEISNPIERENDTQLRDIDTDGNESDCQSETRVVDAEMLWETQSNGGVSESESDDEDNRMVLREARTLMRTLREIGNLYNFVEPEWCRAFCDDGSEDDEIEVEANIDNEKKLSAEFIEVRKKTERLKNMLGLLRRGTLQ